MSSALKIWHISFKLNEIFVLIRRTLEVQTRHNGIIGVQIVLFRYEALPNMHYQKSDGLLNHKFPWLPSRLKRRTNFDLTASTQKQSTNNRMYKTWIPPSVFLYSTILLAYWSCSDLSHVLPENTWIHIFWLARYNNVMWFTKEMYWRFLKAGNAMVDITLILMVWMVSGQNKK